VTAKGAGRAVSGAKAREPSSEPGISAGFSLLGRCATALAGEIEQPSECVLLADIRWPAIGGADRRVELVMGIVELGRPFAVEIVKVSNS
jgi:hypothetical protein